MRMFKYVIWSLQGYLQPSDLVYTTLQYGTLPNNSSYGTLKKQEPVYTETCENDHENIYADTEQVLPKENIYTPTDPPEYMETEKDYELPIDKTRHSIGYAEPDVDKQTPSPYATLKR